MKLYSTRDNSVSLDSKSAIIKGLADDGGLFCPKYEDIIQNKFDIKNLLDLDYKKIAKIVFKTLLSDFSDEELDICINSAYSNENFGKYSDNISPITKIGNDFLLELYHGPTSAFKDVALTILPHFLTTAYNSSKSSSGNKTRVYILTATSGDTGKAALSGFKDVENVFITVFYPTDGVSDMQKCQMQTSVGQNVSVVALKGDFDDCQKLVKEIYTDKKIKEICDKHNVVLSSANSINIGRLVPQIVYYIHSYVELVNKNIIKLYDKINFVVPTGNFGNILAGYIAKLLGLPINKLICASNDNNVLTDFINKGIYDRNRTLYKTISPSMDILISSNLERLLYLLSGNNDKLIKNYMMDLKEKGMYTINADLLSKIKDTFVAEYANEHECKEMIKYAYENDGRLIDTHTAVAYACLKKYIDKSNQSSEKNIILSTASAYKFPKSVLSCIDPSDVSALNDFECLDRLFQITKVPVPKNLSELKNKFKRFNTTFTFDESKSFVVDNIKNTF